MHIFKKKKTKKLKDIINRPEFNALMKYENVEFERNFQVKPTVQSQPTDEPSDSASSSICAQSQTKKSHDDIQVLRVDNESTRGMFCKQKFIFSDTQGTTIA